MVSTASKHGNSETKQGFEIYAEEQGTICDAILNTAKANQAWIEKQDLIQLCPSAAQGPWTGYPTSQSTPHSVK